MRIFHLSAECYPVAKVGGLADVVGALPKYQTLAGHQAAVVMPFMIESLPAKMNLISFSGAQLYWAPADYILRY
ncbi:glycogen/starch synthase [Mucilaginibacter antarcticus]|uniref:glycogen/starch synthase n=1 Tax=Mucilaginibacter antarcticus TaxID=1855725 RepID=UPI00362969F2